MELSTLATVALALAGLAAALGVGAIAWLRGVASIADSERAG